MGTILSNRTNPLTDDFQLIKTPRSWIEIGMKKLDIPRVKKEENYAQLYAWQEKLADKGYNGLKANAITERAYSLFLCRKEQNDFDKGFEAGLKKAMQIMDKVINEQSRLTGEWPKHNDSYREAVKHRINQEL